MRALRVRVHTLKNRLLFGLCSLIFVTALVASGVAYGLAGVRMAQQQGAQLEMAQSAVVSLLRAEQSRMTNHLVLLSERPTLEALLQAQQAFELELYIQDFRSQSSLDFLAIYGADGALVASNGRLHGYDAALGQGFMLVDERPLLVAQQVVHLPDSDLPLGTAVAGVWLERPLLDNFATATGVQLQWSATATPTALSLSNSSGQANLFVEVLLPSATQTPKQQLLWPLVMSTAVLTTSGWFVAWLLVRSQTKSLQKLTMAAQKIGQGNTHAPLPLVADPSEMRHLATALHRLQAQIISHQQQLVTANSLEESTVLTAAGLVFDGSRLTVQRDGKEPVRLTPLEARLLETLIRHPGQVMSSELLITAVWGSDGGDRTMLKQLVYRLRSKIDPENSSSSHIETIPGVGYAFKN